MTEEQRKDFEEAAEKYAHYWYGYDRGKEIGMARDAFLAGCEHAVPTWIDVKERLPANEVNVLVYDSGDTYEAFHINGVWRPELDLLGSITLKVTHWQKLPSPPSSKGN
jgi:hypothetical protein